LLPEADTRELQTDVLLGDGQGVVIGGLIQEKDRNIRKKVAFLGDIYLVGRLFQHAELTKERSEIIVTLVPRIVDSPPQTNEQDAVGAERCQIPLFNGPLERVPRPWEASMPDPRIYQPPSLWQRTPGGKGSCD
jgi:type II secretory pathway component GspD/PulD (secretin)